MKEKNYTVFVNKGFSAAEEYDNISKYEENVASDAYREYRKKWLENPKNLILEGRPLHIDIDPTNFCNLKCTMCSRTVLKIHEGENLKYMDFELFKSIVDEAKKLGVPSVKFGILTEPLLHPRFVDMVQYVSDMGFEDIGVVTNGTLLTEDLAEKLIKAGLIKINISFDSPIKETYEAIRVGANFDKVIGNIRNLIEIRNKLKSPIPLLRITMVKMEKNEQERELFQDLFKPIADRMAFIDYEEYDEDLVDYEVLNNAEFDNYACSELWQRLAIDCDGIVHPCCSGTKYKEFIWNFSEHGLEQIWQQKVSVLRDAFIDNTWKKIPMCGKCLGRIRNTSILKDGKI